MGNCTPLRVMIADDHAVTRESLQATLALTAFRDINVVAEAKDGLEAVTRALDCRPDVILIDLKLPYTGGIEATRQIKRQLPDVAIIILSLQDDDSSIIEAVRAGASGYLPKCLPRHLLFMALLAAKDGSFISNRAVLHDEVSRFSVGGEDGGYNGGSFANHIAMDPLTPRERMVLELLVLGHTNRQIGDQLAITEETAKKHVQSIIAKLGAADRTDAAVRAVRASLC